MTAAFDDALALMAELTATLAPGESIDVGREHSFRVITTRRYYPGAHAIALQINGIATDPAVFELAAPES